MTAPATPVRRINLLAAPAGRLQMCAAVMGGPFESAEAAAKAAGLSPRAAGRVVDDLATGLDAVTVSLSELFADHERIEPTAQVVWANADPVETLIVIAALGPARYIVAAGDLRLVSASVEAAEQGAKIVKAETGAEVVLVEIAASLPGLLRALYGQGSR